MPERREPEPPLWEQLAERNASLPKGDRLQKVLAGRGFGGIERNEAEIAGLEDERQRPNRLLERALVRVAAQPGIGHDMAANPEQPIERDTGRRRRLDVEHVEHVDHGREFAARGCRGDHREHQARAARRARSDNF